MSVTFIKKVRARNTSVNVTWKWLFVGLAGCSVWKRCHVYLSKCVFTLAKGSRSWNDLCVFGEEWIHEACHLMWGWVFVLIWHQWNWVKGLFFWGILPSIQNTQYDPDVCVLTCTLTPLLPHHHTITKPPPPYSPPSLYPLSCLATSFKTSAVNVRERWSDLCLCLFCVCGPSEACQQYQVSAFVCVGDWEKMKGLKVSK